MNPPHNWQLGWADALDVVNSTNLPPGEGGTGLGCVLAEGGGGGVR